MPMSGLSRRQFLETAGAAAGASLIATPGAGAAQDSAASSSITLACADYIRYTPLATGDVRPTGATLPWLRGDRSEMLRRASSDPTVDGGENSLAQHILRVDRGDRSLVAVPVFILRNFTVRDLYTVKGSPLTPPGLNGRRIGIYNWAASGAVWYRQLVRYFGQDPKRVNWVVGSPDAATPINVPVPLPSNVVLAPSGKSLTDLLLAREIDAFFAPLPPRSYHAGDGPIVRLVPEFRPVEARYFKDTGCYPPQHVLLLRRAVWESRPALGPMLVGLFQQCEARFHASQRLYPYNAPWLIAEIEETERLMGPDYHAHGLEKNRQAMDVFCQSAFDDGLTGRRLTVDEVFAEF